MKRIIFNILMIILAFTVQNCIFPLLPFLSASPNLLLILTFSFGFIHGKEAVSTCSTASSGASRRWSGSGTATPSSQS